MARDYAIGIDLHGTLLDGGWTVPEELTRELSEALVGIGATCELFLCTGNDLTFLGQHINGEILGLFDGFILETGCVVSDGSSETVLVPSRTRSLIRELNRRLRGEALPNVQYFARRLATISLFTRTEKGGSDPSDLHPVVLRKIAEMGYHKDVLVTHSDVAVDIVPAGFNKFTGLRLASRARSLIGIADSLNDLHLIRFADLAFLPANASPALLAELDRMNLKVEPLEGFRPGPDRTIARSRLDHTGAVVEVLEFLRHHLQ